jgi:hypothetical protein
VQSGAEDVPLLMFNKGNSMLWGHLTGHVTIVDTVGKKTLSVLSFIE